MIIELDKLTLFHLLVRSFQKYADLPAISSVREPSITYRRLTELVEDISEMSLICFPLQVLRITPG